MKRILLLLFLLGAMLHMQAGDENKLFSLYPVPLKSSKLTVKRNMHNTEFTTVELRNLIGKKLQEKEFPKGAEEVAFEDMDTYPNGVYVVLAKDSYGKILESSKFIINK